MMGSLGGTGIVIINLHIKFGNIEPGDSQAVRWTNTVDLNLHCDLDLEERIQIF